MPVEQRIVLLFFLSKRKVTGLPIIGNRPQLPIKNILKKTVRRMETAFIGWVSVSETWATMLLLKKALINFWAVILQAIFCTAMQKRSSNAYNL